jgi:flagellar hook-length control protein FliK
VRAVASLPASHAKPHGASPTPASSPQAPDSDFAMMLDAMADQTQAPDGVKVAATAATGEAPAQNSDRLETTVSISDAVNTQAKAGADVYAQPGLDLKGGKATDRKLSGNNNVNAVITRPPLTLAPSDVPGPAGTPAPEAAKLTAFLSFSRGKTTSNAIPTGGKAETKSDSKKQQDGADLDAPIPMVQQPLVPAAQQAALIAPIAAPLSVAVPADPTYADVSPAKTTAPIAIAAAVVTQAAGVAVTTATVGQAAGIALAAATVGQAAGIAAAAAVVGQAAGVAAAAAAGSDQLSPASEQIAVVSKADAQTAKILLKGDAVVSASTSQKSELPAGRPDQPQAQIGDSQPPVASGPAVSNGATPAANGKATSNSSGEHKLADIVAMHRSSADPVSSSSDAPPKDFPLPQQWSAAAGQPAASPHADTTAASVAAANSAVANTLQQAPVPLAGVPVLIAARALAGDHQFDIRLDPPELGRIEVRLKVDKQGQISSHLIADRPETLALLRRDGGGLERALQDAGLKTTSGGLQFSLRDQSGNGQPDRRSAPAHVIADSNANAAREPMARNYVRLSGRIGGVDIRI